MSLFPEDHHDLPPHPAEVDVPVDVGLEKLGLGFCNTQGIKKLELER